MHDVTPNCTRSADSVNGQLEFNTYLSLVETQAELANLSNFPAKFCYN